VNPDHRLHLDDAGGDLDELCWKLGDGVKKAA
jgi:hypothetical protein